MSAQSKPRQFYSKVILVVFVACLFSRPGRFWMGSSLYLEAEVLVDFKLRILLFGSVIVWSRRLWHGSLLGAWRDIELEPSVSG